ncbi:MAG: alanine:cation symporter family protein, partial [Clostridia bacterium]
AVVGEAVKKAVTIGCKRGVFSNEAGLGSSVMVHSASNVKEPVVQGMWGIFEVFADTIVVCTMTAATILCSGIVDLSTGALLTGAAETALVAEAFASVFGHAGTLFVSLAILLFAFSTILGWSYYGSKAWEYLLGTKSTVAYKTFFVLLIVVSASLPKAYISLPWDLSDTFNGLMMIPNLIGVLALSGTVFAITKNYCNRRLRGLDEKPMLSYREDIQVMQEEALRQEDERA